MRDSHHYQVPPALISEYLRRYPETGVASLFVDRVVNVVDEGVDAALRVGDLPDSTLQAARVGEVRRVVCASPQYLRKRGTPRLPIHVVHREGRQGARKVRAFLDLAIESLRRDETLSDVSQPGEEPP